MTPRAAARLSTGLRILIGLVLVATAAGKLLDVGGFADVVRSYRALPECVVPVVALAVPLAEAALGAWLLSGYRLAAAGIASAAMHLLYAGWSAAALARGLRLDNCGCFGVFLARPLTAVTVVEDAVMAGLSLLLFRLARRERTP